MNHQQIRDIAHQNGLGSVHFQLNLAQNTGMYFEAGYVSVDGRRSLFCKRHSSSSEDGFYLCNDYRSLNGT